MRLLLTASAILVWSLSNNYAAAQVGKSTSNDPPVNSGKDTPAAEFTRTRLLKVKVTVNFEGTTLRDVLKELAGQVEMVSERPVMWTYSEAIPAKMPIKYSCNNKSLDVVLDELLKMHGLGYVVVSTGDHKHDGWVKLTKGNERGYEGKVVPPSTIDGDDEQKASTRLGIAKELIEKGKPADAKAVLMLVMTKYPKSKAAAEAKELLEKLNK